MEEKSLILIPCCKQKRPSASGTKGVKCKDPRLEESRMRILDLSRRTPDIASNPQNVRGVLSESPLMTPARDLYRGGFYQSAGGALNRLPGSVHVLIVSALYGIVHPLEKIAMYELQMGSRLADGRKVYRFWRDENIWKVLLDYIAENDITSVWSLLPDSMPMFPYNRIFRDLWRGLEIPAGLVKVYNSRGSSAGTGSGRKRGEWLREVSRKPKLLEKKHMPKEFPSIPGFVFEYETLR